MSNYACAREEVLDHAGAWGFYSRVARFIYLELSYVARETNTDGTLVCSRGYKSDLDAVHGLVHGSRREVKKAIEELTQPLGDDHPPVVITTVNGQRVIRLPYFHEQQIVGSHARRQQKYRDSQKKLRDEVERKQALASTRDVTRDVTGRHARDAQSRAERERETEIPPYPPRGVREVASPVPIEEPVMPTPDLQAPEGIPDDTPSGVHRRVARMPDRGPTERPVDLCGATFLAHAWAEGVARATSVPGKKSPRFAPTRGELVAFAETARDAGITTEDEARASGEAFGRYARSAGRPMNAFNWRDWYRDNQPTGPRAASPRERPKQRGPGGSWAEADTYRFGSKAG